MGHVLPVAVMLADVGATSGRRLHYERQPFTLQKTVFYIVKGNLLESKRYVFKVRPIKNKNIFGVSIKRQYLCARCQRKSR